MADIAAVSAQIEDLGQEYNKLEEWMYKLECSDEKKNTQISKLESADKQKTSQIDELHECIKGFEDRLPLHQISVGNAPNAERRDSKQAETFLGPGHSTDHSLQTQLENVQNTLAELSQRLSHVEQNYPSTAPTSSLSTHQLALVLAKRLESGDILSPADTATLVRLLNPNKSFLPTPSLTDAPTRQTTVDCKVDDDVIPRKRGRGRPPRPSLDSNTDSEPPLKRPRGRPPKMSQPSRNVSIESSKSSSAVSGSTAVSESAKDDPPAPSRSSAAERIRTPEVSEAGSGPKHDHAKDDMLVDENEERHNPVIPPERRSARKPKPAKKYDDMLSWKEANLHIQGSQAKTPYTPKK